MLGMLLSVWAMARVALWESPFPIKDLDIGLPEVLLASHAPAEQPAVEDVVVEAGDIRAELAEAPAWIAAAFSSGESPAGASAPTSPPGMTSVVAGGHQMLMAAAFRVDWSSGTAQIEPARVPGRASQLNPPVFAAPYPAQATAAMDRWSLDAFAFYRAGSNAESITQGRAPLYGASQASAILQYRVAPSSRHDPRVYVRGYRALVTDGESEVAAGVSARPIGVVPLRVAAEIRVTESALGRTERPAFYAVTEFPPLDLPLGVRAEAYASGGYVGGRAATPFADGQASLTREIVSFDGPGTRPVRLTLGAGAWGGAQREAHRVDVGPTMRVDLDVGEVPARLSVDWREQVSGDAAPGSGLAATLSTRF